MWRILRLFKQFGVRCTSYAVGQALLQNPDVGRALVEGGHEVARFVYPVCGSLRLISVTGGDG